MYLNEHHVQIARAVLAHLNFVCYLEEIQKCVRMLESRFKSNKMPIPHFTHRKGNTKRKSIHASVVDHIIKSNALDLQLFREVKMLHPP